MKTKQSEIGPIDARSGKVAGLMMLPEVLSDGSAVWDLWIGQQLVVHCITEDAAYELKDAILEAIAKATARR
jgi:hypothetical protein